MYFQLNTPYIEATVPQEASDRELATAYQLTYHYLQKESRDYFREMAGVRHTTSSALVIAACIRFNYSRLNWARKRDFLSLMDEALNHTNFLRDEEIRSAKEASPSADLRVA